MEIFKLFGSIFIDNEKANKSLKETDTKGQGVAKTFSGSIGTIGKWGKVLGATALAGAAAIGGVAIAGTKMANDLTAATNSVASQTGATREEMEGLRQSIKNVFAENFGEGFDDIANVMANVKTQTGLVGPELEQATKNAILLRDTFDFAPEETMKAIGTLTKQFGIEADKAYDLITVGAQKGANKNGDLLDILNEYANQFEGIGMSSEDMINTLVAGADEGIFSMDKVGDAVKEFNIRNKDMSKTSTAAFKKLGFDSDKMFKLFSEGGESAAEATQDVIEALANIEDPLEQNTIGVELFGTQFEDIGPDIINVLSRVTSETEAAVVPLEEMNGALSRINEIRYDDFGTAMEGIKRQMQIGLIEPIEKNVLPLLGQFSTWVQGNMPKIQEWIAVAFDNIGKAIEFVFDFIDDKLMPIFDDLWTWVQNNMPDIQKTAETVFDKILDVVMDLWNAFKKDLLPILQSLWEIAEEIFPIVMEIAVEAFDVIKDAVTRVWDAISVNLLPIFRDILDWVKENMPEIQKIMETVWEIVKGAVDIVVTAFEDLLKGVKNLWEFVDEDFALIGDMIVGAFGITADFLHTLIGDIKTLVDWLGKAIDALTTFDELSTKQKHFGVGFTLPEGLPTAQEEVEPIILPTSGSGRQALDGVTNTPFTPAASTGGVMTLSNGSPIQVNITGNTLLTDDDDAMDRLGEAFVGRLRLLDVNS